MVSWIPSDWYRPATAGADANTRFACPWLPDPREAGAGLGRGAGGVGMAPGSMTGAKKQVMGMAALYGSLE